MAATKMSQPLNVIALISGGKDSIYSILHCLQNGHKVVALGNVYPLPLEPGKLQDDHLIQGVEADEDDLNSYMYQTVGHTVIPLYEEALGVPLYRQPIIGEAVHKETVYDHMQSANAVDETESLVPLLQKVMAVHPEANAVSTGAILSTYQRTRVESVVLRLGLVPLSFLWQYPELPPQHHVSLLMDMCSAGLDARIIKVASGGLDESFLWQNVASREVMQRVERSMAQFGSDGDGAALGEGGEFETLVLDGPDRLFKGHIVVDKEDKKVIKGSGGTAWLLIKRARVEMKTLDGNGDGNENKNDHITRIPNLLSDNFLRIFQTLQSETEYHGISRAEHLITQNGFETWLPQSTKISLKSVMEGQKWVVVGRIRLDNTIQEEVEQIVTQIADSLNEQNMDVTDVISTVVLLRSMGSFTIVNKIYGKLFSKPNPPARVTIACGDVLPPGYNIVIQLSILSRRGGRRLTSDLHIQSRSYWAPANIGPYSQARSEVIFGHSANAFAVHVAGQIPLVPSTMALLDVDLDIVADTDDQYSEVINHPFSKFISQTALSLQHLWRIGQAMSVSYWTGAVAYLSKDSLSNISRKARLASKAWESANVLDAGNDDELDCVRIDESERDLWEERYNRRFVGRGAEKTAKKLPDWSIVRGPNSSPCHVPTFFAAEVEELPRGSWVEWHALLGVTHGPIKQMFCSRHKIGRAYKDVILDRFCQTIVLLDYAHEIPNVAQSVELVLSEMETPEEARLRRGSPGYHHSHAAYLDARVLGLWDADSYAGVIPCLSLWDRDGQKLAAALVFQSFLG